MKVITNYNQKRDYLIMNEFPKFFFDSISNQVIIKKEKALI